MTPRSGLGCPPCPRGGRSCICAHGPSRCFLVAFLYIPLSLMCLCHLGSENTDKQTKRCFTAGREKEISRPRGGGGPRAGASWIRLPGLPNGHRGCTLGAGWARGARLAPGVPGRGRWAAGGTQSRVTGAPGPDAQSGRRAGTPMSLGRSGPGVSSVSPEGSSAASDAL